MKQMIIGMITYIIKVDIKMATNLSIDSGHYLLSCYLKISVIALSTAVFQSTIFKTKRYKIAKLTIIPTVITTNLIFLIRVSFLILILYIIIFFS